MGHDELLFRAAYPRSPEQLRRTEAALAKIRMRDRILVDRSGIAGTSVDTIFSWDIARWLTQRYRGTASLDWDDPPAGDRLATALTPVIPDLRERIVDANVPYLDYAKARDLEWYVTNLDPVVYDLLGLWIRWKFPDRVSRTRLRRKVSSIYYDATIIERREVSIARAFAAPPPAVRTLTAEEGAEALEMFRAALATRYRELYVATFGDPATVISAEAGRGWEILLFGLLPEKRLPVRQGYAPFVFRNGVPAGYGDAYVDGSRIEVSFNIFPEFRAGESAWIFARLLALYRQRFGSATFTIDPYQIGQGNEEAIESGAFWFYRKLGFRPKDAAIERLARAEERKKRRSPASTLRKLAGSGLIYDGSARD